MLKGIFISIFMICTSSLTRANEKSCLDDLKLFGEVSSYYKVKGKKPQKQSKFFLIQGKDLSEHMGNFKNIRVSYPKNLDQVLVGAHRVDLKKKGNFFESKNLELTKILKKNNKERVLLQFRQEGKTICMGEYLGVVGD